MQENNNNNPDNTDNTDNENKNITEIKTSDLSNNYIDIHTKNNSDKKIKEIPLRVKHKKQLVNYILDGIEKSKIPNNVWLLLIKTIHISTPGFCLIIFLLGSFELSIFFLTILNITLLLFLYLNGCFLTTVENKLEKDSVNIIDPYIYFMDDIPSKNNRYYYTLQLSFFYFAFTAFIIYYRHFYKSNILNYFQII